jgi:glycosyltransferase involved in cell wall biosynthesis
MFIYISLHGKWYMDGDTLVSIILPTYNRSELIKRSIDSVLTQKYGNFELIVIDDGSTDNTEEILKSFNDERIRILKNKENKGAAAARNMGISISIGTYIAFQDSDDEWLPQKLNRQVEVLSRLEPNGGIVYSDMLRINKGSIDYWSSPDIISNNMINLATLDYQTFGIGIGSALISRKCFETNGLFDEHLNRLIDLDLFIRLSKNYVFCHIKEPLVKYYATEGISTDLNALCAARVYLMKKYYNEVKKFDSFILNQYNIILEALQQQRKLKHHE